MALFYSPTLKQKPKPTSKTAQMKSLRELRKAIRELEQYDRQLSSAMIGTVNGISRAARNNGII